MTAQKSFGLLRAVATRLGKRGYLFAGTITFAVLLIWLRTSSKKQPGPMPLRMGMRALAWGELPGVQVVPLREAVAPLVVGLPPAQAGDFGAPGFE